MEEKDLVKLAQQTIDVEMALFMEKTSIAAQFAGQSQKKIDERLAQITEMEEVSDETQESIRIARNENRQAALLNSIEIVGLPDDICENTEDIAYVLTQIMHVEIGEQNIRGFETMDEFTGPNLGEEGPIGIHTQTLVVHIVDLSLRNYIISTAHHTKLSFPDSGRVYIYEHLTHMNRMIFRKALQEATRLNIEFVWVQDGKIYARKATHSQVNQIRSDKDIKGMCHY